MQKKSDGGGIGVGTVVQIVFIILKLVNVIDWSWWAVFIPTFIGCAITFFALLFYWR